VLLSDNAIEIEVNPGSVLCLSLSLAVGCPGCRIASFGVGEILLNNSGIRALDADSAGWGSGGGGIARDADEDGEKGMEVGRAVDSRGGSRSRCEEERCLCCDSDREWWGCVSLSLRGSLITRILEGGKAGKISFANSRTSTASSCRLSFSTISRIPNRDRSDGFEWFSKRILVSRRTLSLTTAFSGRERDVQRCSRRGGCEMEVTSDADRRSTFSKLRGQPCK